MIRKYSKNDMKSYEFVRIFGINKVVKLLQIDYNINSFGSHGCVEQEVRMRYAMMVTMLCCMLTGLTACGRENFQTYQTGHADTQAVNEEDTTMDQTDSQAEVIYVDVCGAVVTPGVYILPPDARVCDAVKAAGGFREDAAAYTVNQAGLLSDGEQLYIRSVSEQDTMQQTQQIEDGLVNINTATKEQLMQLPGIGETKAADIIAYRDAHGDFAKPEDLMQVPGIKEGLYEKLKERIKN